MSLAVKPCDPPASASALLHCDCWVFGDACCWCGDATEPADETDLHGCGAWN